MRDAILNWIRLACILSGVFAVSCAGPGNLEKTPKDIPADANLLRVGVSVKAPPLIFKNGRRIVGLEADFARELANYLGKELVFVELKWTDLIPALLDNRIDIIMSGMTITDTRRMRIDFSDPYFLSGQMAMIRTADALTYITLMQDGRIGYVRGTTGERFVKDFFPGTRKVGFRVSEDGVKALIDKKIDILVHDGPIILYLASKYEIEGVAPVYNVMTEEYLAWGIRRDNEQLKAAVNGFLQDMKKDGRLDAIVQEWIPLIKKR